MAIKFVDDVLPPSIIGVTRLAINYEIYPALFTMKVPITIGVITALSYVAAAKGASSNFAKNLGIATLPWAAKSIYQYFTQEAWNW